MSICIERDRDRMFGFARLRGIRGRAKKTMTITTLVTILGIRLRLIQLTAPTHLTWWDRVAVWLILRIADEPDNILGQTGVHCIHTIGDAMLWRLASLPGLDADVGDDGHVRVFRDLGYGQRGGGQ